MTAVSEKKPKVFKALKPAPPDEPATFTDVVAFAIQAMINGTASDHQQRLGMEWIITQASNAHGQHYHASDSDRCFALGRAFVGQQLIGIAKINLIALTQPSAKER